MEESYKIIGTDGREYGPVKLEELRQWCTEGRVGPATLVWMAEETRWQPAAAVDQLKWDLPAPPPIQSAASNSGSGSGSGSGSSASGSGDDLDVGINIPGINVREAGFWIRFTAYLVDFLILGSMVALVTLPWADLLEASQTAALAEVKKAAPDFKILWHFWLLVLAINVPANFLYFVGFNGAWGATPGKLILGLRILDANGGPIGFKRAFLRHCAEWITRLTFGLGFLLVLFTPEKRALHDLIARTRVVWFRPSEF